MNFVVYVHVRVGVQIKDDKEWKKNASRIGIQLRLLSVNSIGYRVDKLLVNGNRISCAP